MTATTTSNSNTTGPTNTPPIDVQEKVRETVNHPHNQTDRVKRQAVVLTVIAEGFNRQKVEEWVPEKEWFTIEEPEPEEPDTEPLDGDSEDHYGLHDPISSNTDGLKRRYVENGEPVCAFEANGRYLGKRRGQETSAEKHGYTNGDMGVRARKQYGVLKHGERDIFERFDNVTIAFISLRLSPETTSRIDLLRELKAGTTAVLSKLSYRLQRSTTGPQLDNSGWEYYGLYAATDGRASPHTHLILYLNTDSLDKSVLEPLVTTYVENCEYASMRKHGPDSDAITVRSGDAIPFLDGDDTTALSTYVGQQLAHLKPLDSAELDDILHYSTIHADGNTAFFKSNGFPNMSETDAENVSPNFDIDISL